MPRALRLRKLARWASYRSPLVRDLKWDRHLNPHFDAGSERSFGTDTERHGAERAHRAPVPQATSRHAWAKTHKMANSVADTVTVYNKEADIALPITLVRLRHDVDGTK